MAHLTRQRQLLVDNQGSKSQVLETVAEVEIDHGINQVEVTWHNLLKTVRCRTDTEDDARRSVLQAWGLPLDVKIEELLISALDGV